jgi:hypothetical protein
VLDQQTDRLGASDGSKAACTLLGEVKGHGLYRVSPSEIPALRRRPGPVPEGWVAPAASLLRNSDEQTIAGLCAVFTAIKRMGWPQEHCQGWGVIAASRFLGRANLARALQSFLAEGVWGTSPHLIPHFALHSASGTISLGLGLHGPNLGVGGGLYASAEGFLTALTWLTSGTVPGVWLVLSAWSPELIPDRGGGPPIATECQALAIALLPPAPSGRRLTFQASFEGDAQAVSAPLDLVALDQNLLAGRQHEPRMIATDPLGRLRIDLREGPVGPG